MFGLAAFGGQKIFSDFAQKASISKGKTLKVPKFSRACGARENIELFWRQNPETLWDLPPVGKEPKRGKGGVNLKGIPLISNASDKRVPSDAEFVVVNTAIFPKNHWWVSDQFRRGFFSFWGDRCWYDGDIPSSHDEDYYDDGYHRYSCSKETFPIRLSE